MPTVTWDTENKGNGTIESDGLTASVPNSSTTIRASHGKTKGKWYWEIKTITNGRHSMIGIFNNTLPMPSIIYNDNNSRIYYGNTGEKFNGTRTPYGSNFADGDVIGIALDLDNGTITFFKNGVSQGMAFHDVKALGEVYPVFSSGGSVEVVKVEANFGATPFRYPTPDGYKPYASLPYKALILSENEYKRLALTEGIEKSVNMEEGSTVNIASNVWTVGNLIKLNRNLKLNMVGYYTGTSSSIGIRIYDNLTSDVIFSGDRVSTIQGWNYFDISDVLLEKDKEYVVGFYGNIIHGRTIPLPTIYHSINNDFSMTVIERRQATSDIFPSTVATVYLPIIDLIGVLEEDEIKEWETISQSLPTLSQFQEDGMDDLSILNRKVQNVIGTTFDMQLKEELGEGRVFSKEVDLKKYFDLRKLEVR